MASTEYGSKLHVWNWRERTLRQSIELGPDGLIPLETRFLHDPQAPVGFVVRHAGRLAKRLCQHTSSGGYTFLITHVGI